MPRRDSAAAAGESNLAAARGKAQSRESHPRPAAARLSGRTAPVLYRAKPRSSLWQNQQKPAGTSEQDFSGDAATGIVQFDLGGHDGAVADRRPFSLRYSLPGLGVPGSGYRPALVSFTLWQRGSLR